jgi:DNA recombination protein RmuC
MPGKGESPDSVVWLPIDAKFPKEDYERLIDASEKADVAGVEESAKMLETRIKLEAKTFREKYIDPPHTTDFGLLFLPTEGLYAEVLRRPGLTETLQREYRVMVAGPTTLLALLNSLQMGFQSLAIEKRSAEIRDLLGAVKTEFGTFGEWIEKVHKKIQAADVEMGKAKTRTRAIEKKLRSVESLPAPEARALLAEVVEAAEEGEPEPPAEEPIA